MGLLDTCQINECMFNCGGDVCMVGDGAVIICVFKCWTPWMGVRTVCMCKYSTPWKHLTYLFQLHSWPLGITVTNQYEVHQYEFCLVSSVPLMILIFGHFDPLYLNLMSLLLFCSTTNWSICFRDVLIDFSFNSSGWCGHLIKQSGSIWIYTCMYAPDHYCILMCWVWSDIRLLNCSLCKQLWRWLLSPIYYCYMHSV